jgi:hypothetical protein
LPPIHTERERERERERETETPLTTSCYVPLITHHSLTRRHFPNTMSLRGRVGQLSVSHTEASIVRITGLSRNVVRYWMKKSNDNTFHPLPHGGARRFLMTAAQHTLAEAVLLTILELHPASTLEGLAAMMRGYGCLAINKPHGCIARCTCGVTPTNVCITSSSTNSHSSTYLDTLTIYLALPSSIRHS